MKESLTQLASGLIKIMVLIFSCGLALQYGWNAFAPFIGWGEKHMTYGQGVGFWILACLSYCFVSLFMGIFSKSDKTINHFHYYFNPDKGSKEEEMSVE